ncbi:MAG: peptide-methionine (S)-S-oxide reductase MsrA [Elusimicrobiota bacterium]
MIKTATFGAGCFWGVESFFRAVPGVVDAVCGYTGGHFKNPTYEDVCSGATGHAEAVRVSFDPMRVSYEDILRAFWENHDPTTPNRQGPDVGDQYRSVVFYHDEDQRARALAAKKKLAVSGRYPRPIVTEISPASEFYRAEEYHQRYFEKHGGGACHARKS